MKSVTNYWQVLMPAEFTLASHNIVTTICYFFGLTGAAASAELAAIMARHESATLVNQVKLSASPNNNSK